MKKRAQKVVNQIVSPMENFLALETASGILLMLATIIAMLWANSPWHESYHHLVHLPVSLSIGNLVLSNSFAHWVNDGLMVIFFFVVGLEIKAELIRGELSSPKKAALPMFAALGGMVVPALFYLILNKGEVGEAGWGIPMATDIAFAVGVLTLLGKRVPFSLKVFLLALAIVDDLGAVLVIAFFYTSDISQSALGGAAVTFAVVTLFRYAGIRSLLIYTVLGIVAWFFVLQSGVHATIAGVILGLMTPLEAYAPKETLAQKLTAFAHELEDIISKQEDATSSMNESTIHKLDQVKKTATETLSPLERIIHALHPWVSFVIMPVFAFVNAGVHIDFSNLGPVFQDHITIGIILGLVLGKPLGVILFSLLAVGTKVADLPKGVTWMHMAGAGCLAGIGFTMALFIAGLALPSQELIDHSKVGILSASLLAAIVGIVFFYLGSKPKQE